MCGICSAIGGENKIFEVLNGLKKMEYRGYDSSGIAYFDNGKIKVIKSIGEIKNLEKEIDKSLYSNNVIGHTRWATHGKVSFENAHPHLSQDKRYALVHNGIVENFETLREKLLSDIDFLSQTDTEVLVNLIAKQQGSTLQKLISACSLVEGSFALCLQHEKEQKIYLAKRKSPLMVAKNEHGCMASSDMSVFAGRFETCYIMNDNEFAVMDNKNILFFDKNGKKIEKNAIFIKNCDFCEENNSEKYFMLKEIKEQSLVIKRTFFKYFVENVFLQFDDLKKYNSFHFIACGTAFHSALLGARFIQKFCHKKCEVSVASEFRYDDNVLSKKCLYVFVSQSGETADTIACAEIVANRGFDTMAVTNVPYCSLNNLTKFVLPTFAGKEVAVASTKAYTAQVFTLLILALKISGHNYSQILKNFSNTFEIEKPDENVVNFVSGFKKIFFIGRQQDYVTSLEGALKLKEIAYVNCLGMAGGELKHGTLALVDGQTLVIALSTQFSLKEKMESNIQEVKARGGKILLLSQFEPMVDVDMFVPLAKFEEFLMPIVGIVPLQFLAFAYATKLGLNPDKPRNLAKSVTVE